MVFYPASWTPELKHAAPDNIPIPEFMLNEKHGRLYSLKDSRNFFTCGVSGLTRSPIEVKQQVESIAKALSKNFGWQPNTGTAWDKVAGIFSVNTIDFVPLTWAIHYLGGIASPANAQYSADEVAYQLKDSGSKCLFTCIPLLKTAVEAATKAGISKDRIYILELPKEILPSAPDVPFKTLSQLVEQGRNLPPLEPLKWSNGEGAKRPAYLCYSSGTSGLPKGVMISHHNVISNSLQLSLYEQRTKKQIGTHQENVLGLLPMSHIYSLVVISHSAPYQGDGVIVLPKFDLNMFLNAIQTFKINTLFLVPPIVVMMANLKDTLAKFDLSSVTAIFSGAAPLGSEMISKIAAIYPKWLVRQGYGLTETSTVVTSTSGHDIFPGSAGSLLPGIKARLVDLDGKDVTALETPGELWVSGPAVTLGYLNNKKATDETYVTDKLGRWLRTGDEAIFKKSPAGNEHLFITDRIKELIKVKGLQVAPAELEGHLLGHEYVADAAVIGVPDDRAGELPKAFIVKANGIGIEESDAAIKRAIRKHVEKSKSRHKWLDGGVEFVDEIPKNPSGKILRRLLRDKDREAQEKKKEAKL